MIKVTVDPKSVAKFGQRLRDFAFVTKQTASDCAKEQAALFCQDMAVFTPPVIKGAGGGGLSKSAEIAGKGAVSGDIRKMFVVVGDKNLGTQIDMVMRNMAAATRDGNMALFDRIVAKSPVNVLRGLSPVMRKILNDGDHTRAFSKAKNYLSRVAVQSNQYAMEYEQDLSSKHNQIKARFGGRIKKGQRIGSPRMLVENKNTLDAYIKDRQKAVGFIKSGWLTTLRQIPQPVINGMPKNFGAKLANAPEFIQRHSSANGYAKTTTNTQGFMITVGNRQGNVNSISDESNALSLALENRAKQMELRIKRFLKLAADKSNAAKK